MVDTASVFVNDLKSACSNSRAPVGVLSQDEVKGARLKQTIINLESRSKKTGRRPGSSATQYFPAGLFQKEEIGELDVAQN